MNIPAAIRLINDARRVNCSGCPDTHEIDCRLKEALAALQPQRYVMYEGDNIFIVDTHHPEYRNTESFAGYDPWVVLFWIDPGPIERQKARAIVEHLNSTTANAEP